MKTIPIATAFACALFGSTCATAQNTPARDTAPDAATPRIVCLDATHIDHTAAPNDHTILFYMRGGKIWRNTLKEDCPGLHAEQAFSRVIRGGEICSNQQMIQVINRETPCALGTFTPYTQEHSAASD